MLTIYVAVALSLVLLLTSGALFIFGAQTEQQSKVFQRFRAVTGYGQDDPSSQDLDEELLEGSFYERAIYPFLQSVADLISGEQETKREKLERQLITAGRPGNLQASEFIALQIVLGLLSIAIVIFVALLVGPTSLRGIALSVVFAAAAGLGSYAIPRFYLGLLITRRKQEIRHSLPFAIDLLVVSAEAGLGFEMALNRVVEKMEGALAEEFKRLLEEIKLGAPRRQALRSMADRVEVEDFSTFVSAIIQAEDLGSSIGQTLRVQADQMRTARRQELEEKAQQAPIKMLFPMVGCIFPTIFIVIIGPVALKVYQQFSQYMR